MDEIKSVFSSGSSDLSRERKAVSHAKICGGKGIRTPGLLIANETLYQLSYTPVRQLPERANYHDKKFLPRHEHAIRARARQRSRSQV